MRRPPRGKQGPEDANEIAFRVAAEASADGDNQEQPKAETVRAQKARRAGAEGGAARAASLTAEQRSEIARRAAAARWGRRRDPD